MYNTCAAVGLANFPVIFIFVLRLEGKEAFQSIEPPHLSFEMIDSVTLLHEAKLSLKTFDRLWGWYYKSLVFDRIQHITRAQRGESGWVRKWARHSSFFFSLFFFFFCSLSKMLDNLLDLFLSWPDYLLWRVRERKPFFCVSPPPFSIQMIGRSEKWITIQGYIRSIFFTFFLQIFPRFRWWQSIFSRFTRSLVA